MTACLDWSGGDRITYGASSAVAVYSVQVGSTKAVCPPTYSGTLRSRKSLVLYLTSNQFAGHSAPAALGGAHRSGELRCMAASARFASSVSIDQPLPMRLCSSVVG